MPERKTVADKVNDLCRKLMHAGFHDAALEVTIKFSELNDTIEKNLPPLTQLGLTQPVNFRDPSTMALLQRDLEVLNRREKLRESYFEKHIMPYGFLLMYPIN